MAEPADINVDELRRRARRRLIGAIVLALGAAVIVPMLLESDPKPLGDDVSVKIPSIDDGKFVNRLNDPQAKPEAAPPPAKSVGDAEKAVVSPPTKISRYDTALPAEKTAPIITPPPVAAVPAPAPDEKRVETAGPRGNERRDTGLGDSRRLRRSARRVFRRQGCERARQSPETLGLSRVHRAAQDDARDIVARSSRSLFVARRRDRHPRQAQRRGAKRHRGHCKMSCADR